jgi:hypothetical protein
MSARLSIVGAGASIRLMEIFGGASIPRRTRPFPTFTSLTVMLSEIVIASPSFRLKTSIIYLPVCCVDRRCTDCGCSCFPTYAIDGSLLIIRIKISEIVHANHDLAYPAARFEWSADNGIFSRKKGQKTISTVSIRVASFVSIENSQYLQYEIDIHCV